MRVLYLLRYYPTLTETFVNQEIAAHAAAGLAVTVASLGARADGALAEELPPVPLLRVPRRPLTGRLSAPSAGQRWLAEVQRPKDAARLPWLAARARGFDRIHVHFAGEAAEFARALHLDLGLPYTVTVHAADLWRPRPALRAVLADAEAVATVCKYNVVTLSNYGLRPHLIRCGPDLARWPPAPRPEGPLRALFVGRAVPKKGLDVLLAAWESLDRPAATLDVVSDYPGPLPPGARRLGLLPPAGVRAALRAASLMVLPCRQAPDGDRDGVPLVLMEALAMGRAAISTPVGGVPELLDEAPGDPPVGWLVPPEDPGALCAALQEAADRPDLLAARGAAGPARLIRRGFTLSAQVAGLRALWGLAPQAGPAPIRLLRDG